MAFKKKKEVKTVIDAVEEKGLKNKIYKVPNQDRDEEADATILIAKQRNDSGVITGFKTKDDVILNVDDITKKLVELGNIKAKNREGILSSLSSVGGEIITADGHNLGHLPDC